MAKTEDLKQTVLRIPYESYDYVKEQAKINKTAINTMLVQYIETAIGIEKIEQDMQEVAFDKMIEEEYISASDEDLNSLADRELSNIEKGRIAKRLLLEGLIKAADDEQMGRVFDVLVSMFNEYNQS